MELHRNSPWDLDFNKQLEVLVPKPGRGAITNPAQAFNKTDVFPVGIYAISEDLDSKYVLQIWVLHKNYWNTNQSDFRN
jgi:hypothetical protein